MGTSLRYGFTLIETIVTVALTAVVMLALTNLIVYFYRTNAYVLEQSKAVYSARTSIDHAVADLREASYGADGSYPILSVATSSMTFFGNIDTDSAIEKVRYYLSAQKLYRGVTKPSSNPPSYVGAPEVTTLVVDNIRNGSTPLFTYFDANGVQLTDPINTTAITSVHVTVSTDVNPNRAPEIYMLSGTATLRNIRNAVPQ